MKMRIYFISKLIALLISTQLHPQVTIGAGLSPVNGALLDLKQTTVTNGENAKKGLMFPRINLTDRNSLIDISDIDNTNIAQEKKAHTGLTVYNTNSNLAGGIGIYSWDGARWANVGPYDLSHFVAIATSGNALLDIDIIGSASVKTIAVNTVLVDTRSSYDALSGTYTVAQTGTYAVYGRLAYSGISLLSTVGLYLFKKPKRTTSFTQVIMDDASGLLSLSGGTRLIDLNSIQLNEGDQLKFGLKSTGLLNLNVADGGKSVTISVNQK